MQTNPAFLRDELYKRERGVCQKCGIDCDALAKRLQLRSKCPQHLELEEQRKILVERDPRFVHEATLLFHVLKTGCVALASSARALPERPERPAASSSATATSANSPNA